MELLKPIEKMSEEKDELGVQKLQRKHSGAVLKPKEEPPSPNKGFIKKLFSSTDFGNSTDNFIFDQNTTVVKEEKKKTNYFGVSLTSIMRMEGEDKNIPRILIAITSHLRYEASRDTEMFREHPSELEISKFVKECNDSIERVFLLRIKHSNTVVADTLVKFLAELPYPLIGEDYYNTFLSYAFNDKALDSLVKEIHNLNKLNSEVLRCIMETLYILYQGGKVNGLTSPLLASIFGPLIFKQKNPDYQLRHKECQLCLTFIRNYPYIFKMTEQEKRFCDKCYNGSFPGPLEEEINKYQFKELSEDEIKVLKKKDSSKKLEPTTSSVSLGIVRKKKKQVKKGVIKYKISNTKWKDIFIILRTDKLVFFNSKQDWKDGVKQFQSLFFKYGVVEKEEVKDHSYCFSLFCNNLTHYFECKDEEERQDWMRKIVDTINGKYNDLEHDIVVKNKHNEEE